MRLADLLLGLADLIAPSERRDWFKAMKAEQGALQSGHLNWAAGCVAASMGLRLTKDGIYAALICAAIWFIENDPLFFLSIQSMPRPVYMEYMNLGLYPPLIYMFAICLLLGVYRPRLIVLTSVVLIVIGNLWGLYQLYFLMPQEGGYEQHGLWSFLQTLSIHDAKPLIGIFSDFGACLVGGLIGRWVADRIRWPKGQAA